MATMKMAKSMMLSDPDINTILIAGGYRNGDFVDLSHSRSRFLMDLSCGGGALLLQKNYPRNHVLESVVRVDGSFSLDVIVPVGGTMHPLSPEDLATREYRLDVPDPEGMKERLDKIGSQVSGERLASTATLEDRYRRNISYAAKAQVDIATVEAGSAGLASGTAKKDAKPAGGEQAKDDTRSG